MSLTIVLPIYNVASYLERCLDSVLVDNRFRGEVICVNDGSTDDSLSILERYAAKYGNVRIITQPNAGLSAARNTGLDAATGDYVFFLDSDDWIFPNKLDEVLSRVNGEDVVYFNATRYFEETQQYEPVREIAELQDLSGAAYFAAAERQRRNTPMVCVWGGLYKRSFLLEHNLYNEPGIYHEDSYFTPQVLLRAQHVSCVNICLYAYRIRQGSITTTVRQKHIEDMLFVCRGLYAKFRQENVAEDVFYQFVSNYYAVTITEACRHNQPFAALWHWSDSVKMLRAANSGLVRRMAKLSFVSPDLSYRYGQNQIKPILRRICNRFL